MPSTTISNTGHIVGKRDHLPPLRQPWSPVYFHYIQHNRTILLAFRGRWFLAIFTSTLIVVTFKHQTGHLNMFYTYTHGCKRYLTFVFVLQIRAHWDNLNSYVVWPPQCSVWLWSVRKLAKPINIMKLTIDYKSNQCLCLSQDVWGWTLEYTRVTASSIW